MTIAIGVLACGIAWAFWVVIGYPLWLALYARFSKNPPNLGDYEPTITAIIPVYNGVGFLEAKTRSVLDSAYPRDKLSVLILSDGSTDGTDELGAELSHRFPDRVRFMRLPRRGKAAALNTGMTEANAEVLVLTDVRQCLDRSCVASLARSLFDPQVGVASGNLKTLAGETMEEASVGLYWRYESWIRRKLSLIDSIIGATGGIYAIRRELAHPLPLDCILDDIQLPMRVVLAGYRSVLNEQAVAWDFPTGINQEFNRKVRTQAGVFQLLWQLPEVLSPRNRLVLGFCSLKLGRLLLPEVLLSCCLAAFWLPPPLTFVVLAGPSVFLAMGALDVLLPVEFFLKRLTSMARTVVVLLTAALCALAIFFVKPGRLWKKTQVRRSKLDRGTI